MSAIDTPWQRCDTATRRAMQALRLLATQVRTPQALEELAGRSGLSVMTVARALRGHGCNLAEFLCLCSALGQPPVGVIAGALSVIDEPDPSTL